MIKDAPFFEGLKVLELASVLAGPAVGMFFAELGAEVIKIENASTNGDVTRRWRLPGESKESPLSAYYCSINYNKKVHLLNLKAEEDKQKVYALAEDADIIISNFKGHSAEKLGMSYQDFKARKPDIIYAQLTGFGPAEDLPAFDVVLQAEAGFLFMTGEPGRPPVKMPVALIDLLAAHQLKEGILMALLKKVRTGKGSLVSTSLLESAIASLANQATNWLMEGHIPQPMGSQHPNIAPYGDIFYCHDNKPIVIAVGTEKHFTLLCESIGHPSLSTDDRFSTNADRVANRPALNELLEPVFKQHTRAEWLNQLQRQGVPVGSIRNMEEVFERPQAQALVLEDELSDGRIGRRVSTVAFSLE
jgi:crotonobetainyl-CoA:carnitine CoA-transferase CaiB-like acyl-CoA transferase